MTELRALTLSELMTVEMPPKEYIADPFLPKKGLVEIYASAGIGKTTFALSLAMAAALGKPFLKWNVSKPWNVLYIDGEMAAVDMRERIEAASQSFGASPEDVSRFKLLSRDYCDGHLPDIGSIEGQMEFAPETSGADLIFLDNLSCLNYSGKENDADAWSVILRWLLKLKNQEKSVVILHHAGKNGTSRGTSRREDTLDTVIKLDRPSGYTQADGAKFEVHFEKTRSFSGPEAEPVGLAYNVVGGFACWETFQITNEKEAEVVRLLASGMKQTEVAEALGISQSEVSKRKNRAIANGLL